MNEALKDQTATPASPPTAADDRLMISADYGALLFEKGYVRGWQHSNYMARVAFRAFGAGNEGDA